MPKVLRYTTKRKHLRRAIKRYEKSHANIYVVQSKPASPLKPSNIQKSKKPKQSKQFSHSKPPKKGGLFAPMKQHAPQTVQQSIPYQQLYADGICRITDNKYSKTIQYFDINYQLCATRSHTNAIPLTKSLRAQDHIAVKMGGYRISGSNNLYFDEWNEGVTP